MTSSFTPVRLGPGDIGVDPAYWAKDNSDLLSTLENEQLKRLEKRLTQTNGNFEELVSNAEQYSEIIYWLGTALFTLIKANSQIGRNRYVPARKHVREVEFEVSEALDLLLAVLWEEVRKEALAEYDRQIEKEIPF